MNRQAREIVAKELLKVAKDLAVESSEKTAKSNIVLINDLWNDVKYFTRRGLDSTDRQVFKLVNNMDDVITMGKIIGVPIKFWKSKDRSDFRKHGLDEKFEI